ncbi:MAG: sulfur oxidation c-type cytochrome SoxA [gamma proteobacterium symbiont of Lucinoma myriamae]|nr:sulfur oxidation c-type cytochrome SoxA [gamma proteobacterium symbiont of Lucinoma myriamae]MCU7817311.1 sulfur oxidation c-type cytochrome SoxA [gamma proteobacterium symbiont of Lucinoma myriamae]MCU7831877.1 sulfur oxidation c-type cytochrome SoxA [gamma proteobacterium symbiont of Lucinoma myriamae]
MNKLILKLILTGLLCTAISSAYASPEKDREALIKYVEVRFPGIALEEFANGAYAYDTVGRESWEAIEEFPPYEIAVDDGQEMWEQPFANGKSYKDCFADGPVIAQNYPHWDKKQGMVITLALALNQCRKANGEKPLKYKKGSINNMLSYISFASRGKKTNVVIPEADAGAMAAYEDGKKFFYTRRGQLNFSCATCHVQNAGNKIRSETLSAALGHTTHFPVYRSKWGAVGTLHRRFTGCNKQVRAKPFKAQGEEYRNLEYFLTYMSNGLELNGPGARK